MSYKAEFNGWDKLSIDDLLVAYRKAKADCFFENCFPTAINFAEYEQNLLDNLARLLSSLQSKEGFSSDKELLGNYRLVPKKLGTKLKSSTSNGHVHFSTPERAFASLTQNYKLKPEFRIIGDFPVDTHILSALWINTVGHKFDACLSDQCYGSRLRRLRDDSSLSKATFKPFHIAAIGSFSPYFQPYQRWRNDGLNSIRQELKKERDVIAVSLDLKSYYHLVDPMAISSAALHKELGLVNEKTLSEHERQFTAELAKFLQAWSTGATLFANESLLDTEETENISGGLVIGLSATRIISNVLLHPWDQLIKQKLTPIHYGRYVDDMFLVIRDPGTIYNSENFMSFLKERLGKLNGRQFCVSKEDGSNLWKINLGKRIQKNTTICLQDNKQKLFILHGQAGLDLLDSIEKEICELSSEHRLMPSPDQLEHSTAAKVLSAAGGVGEQADTLRRADGLTIRRLSWSLQLRHVESLARDLSPGVWKEQREEFYDFAHNHILRPDKIFEHFNYLPRLLGFAVSLNEWTQAKKIVDKTFDAFDKLEKAGSDGVAVNGSNNVKQKKSLWSFIRGALAVMFVDAAARYYDPNKYSDEPSSLESRLSEKLFFKQIVDIASGFEALLNLNVNCADFYHHAPLLAKCDLAKIPYKHILHHKTASLLLDKVNAEHSETLLAKFESINLIKTDDLNCFLKSSISRRLGKEEANEYSESIFPYLFPTRPYTPDEIAELAPECVGLDGVDGKQAEVTWAKYTQAVRGVWVKPVSAQSEAAAVKAEKSEEIVQLDIGTQWRKKVVVALTNLQTDDDDWAAMACGKPNLSLERYKRISELVNQTIKLSPKPDYVLFPELSIPLTWVNSIAARFMRAGISFIAGTEYRHRGADQIVSEACLALSDNRLGFPAWVKIWQEKLEPAVGEDKSLTSLFGKNWYAESIQKPVYNHNNFCFGLMVCYELQNSKARVAFQGQIDALMVLSWNQDLETFSALIESAALDIHAYIILVNNRKFGDSRVRSPAKESFLRDLARIRGGENDFVVAVTLDLEGLRAFQSRAKRWPEKDDKFKPVPEGFDINLVRKMLPPK